MVTVRPDSGPGADATLRQEIETFSHVIFSSSPAQREFWLGKRRRNRER